MCGKFYGLGMVVFAFAFGLGVSVPEIFISKALPAQNSIPAVNPAPVDHKNCVPVDGSLKYRTLENKELPVVPKPAHKTPPVSEKSEGKKSAREKWEKPKSSNEPEFDRSTENSGKLSKLVHLEKCFEDAPSK